LPDPVFRTPLSWGSSNRKLPPASLFVPIPFDEELVFWDANTTETSETGAAVMSTTVPSEIPGDPE
jgi:hypothetical protein